MAGEQRRYQRITRGFFLHFRPWRLRKTIGWNVSAVHDIGMGGCAFQSNEFYPVGEILEIQIKLPGVDEPMHFLGEVKVLSRARNKTGSQEKNLDIHKLQVAFIEMDLKRRQDLADIIEFHLGKR